MARRKVIAGNWKMNMTPSQAKAFIEELYPNVKGKHGCDIIVCVPGVPEHLHPRQLSLPP